MWGRLNNASSPNMTQRSEIQSINKSVCIIDRFVFCRGLLRLTAVELPALASELLIKGEDIRGRVFNFGL